MGAATWVEGVRAGMQLLPISPISLPLLVLLESTRRLPRLRAQETPDDSRGPLLLSSCPCEAYEGGGEAAESWKDRHKDRHRTSHPMELVIDSGAIRGEWLELDGKGFMVFKVRAGLTWAWAWKGGATGNPVRGAARGSAPVPAARAAGELAGGDERDAVRGGLLAAAGAAHVRRAGRLLHLQTGGGLSLPQRFRPL